jgi:hypothetical protein
LDNSSDQNIPGHSNTHTYQEVTVMKRLGILLIAAMLGLVLACGSKEEQKAPAKQSAPPAAAEKATPSAPPATLAPPASEHPKPDQPKPEHPK